MVQLLCILEHRALGAYLARSIPAPHCDLYVTNRFCSEGSRSRVETQRLTLASCHRMAQSLYLEYEFS